MEYKTKFKNYKYLIGLFILISLVTLVIKVKADDVNTQITVINDNAAPSFTVDVAENPSSDWVYPTNVGDAVTFTATGTDPNGDSYYLTICKTVGIVGEVGSQPTCTGDAWCISGLTISGTQATCTYVTTIGDAETQDWYAYLCDNNNSTSLCSTVSQGNTLDAEGSPFSVNRSPDFTTLSNTGAVNPGASIAWTTVASDPDTATASDAIKLVVCSTNSFNTVTDTCNDTVICESGYVASNPSCNYAVDLGTSNTTINGYGFIIDNHGLESQSIEQGSSSSSAINNVPPEISNIVINDGNDIVLSAGILNPINITADVTDLNGCTDISAIGSVTYSFYRSGIGYISCDTNAESNSNSCYPSLNCTMSLGEVCTDGVTSVEFTCTAFINYNADPTVTSTKYPGEDWLATIKATDSASNTAVLEASSGVEIQTTVGISLANVTNNTLVYDSRYPGDSDSTLGKEIIFESSGNTGIDLTITGTDLTSGTNVISATNQKFALTPSATFSNAQTLGTSIQTVSLNIPKTTDPNTKSQSSLWWGLSVPENTPPGIYTGTQVYLGVISDSANW